MAFGFHLVVVTVVLEDLGCRCFRRSLRSVFKFLARDSVLSWILDRCEFHFDLVSFGSC